jgi:two-component system, NarL family, sensor kinase
LLPCPKNRSLGAESNPYPRTAVRSHLGGLPSDWSSAKTFPRLSVLLACLLWAIPCASAARAEELGSLSITIPAPTKGEQIRCPSTEQAGLSYPLRIQPVVTTSDRSTPGPADLSTSAGDVRLPGPPPFWKMKQLAPLLIFLSWFLGPLAWLVFLRRRVREQIRLFREWLHREAALKEQYRDLFENANDIIFTCDLDGGFTSLNKAGEKITGYTRQEVLHRNLAEVIAPEQRSRLAEALRRLRSGEVSLTGEWQVIAKDGRRLTLEVSKCLLVEAGEPVEVQGIARDITGRTQVEEARKLLALIIESTDDAVISNDPDGHIVSWNQGARDLYGYTAEEVQGKPISLLVPPEHWEQLQGIQEKLRQGERVSHFESLGLTKDGRSVDISLTCSPLKDAAGQFQGSAAIILDITARKRAEREIQERTACLNSLIQNSPLGIVVTDSEGRVKLCNPAFERLFLYHQAEILEANLHDLIDTQETPLERAARDRVFGSGETVHFTSQRRRKNGKLLDVEVYQLPLVENAKITTSLHLYQDITQRKQAERAMGQLSGRLLKLQDEERRRLARELHDTTVQALAALVMNLTVLETSASTLDAKSRNTLSDSLTLAEQCAREVRTLSYLLHPPLLDEVGLAAALRHYVEGFSQRSGLHVALDLPCDWGRLPADAETALFRVVQESLTNIHRHSGSRQAKVRLTCPASEVRLEVEDEGKGIPPEIRDNADGAAFGLGVGILGMRERLRQLGGRLEIHSNGHGTTVRAVLPVQGGNHGSSSHPGRG